MDAPREYADRDGPYQLPNDATEHERLELQSAAIEQLAHGQPFRAPVAQRAAPRRILDVGCGTGAVTVQLARRFPDAQVVGVDLSPVPLLHDPPPNVAYVQGDFLKLAGEQEKGPEDKHDQDAARRLLLSPGTFDYVFARQLHFGIRDWPAFVAAVHRVLAPGGWVELQENEPGSPRRPGTGGGGNDDDDDEIDHQALDGPYRMIMGDLEATGLDMSVGSKLPGYLRAAGLVGVDATVFRWPITRPLPTQPEAEMLYAYCMQYVIPMLDTVIDKVCAPRHDKETIEEAHRWLATGWAEEHEPGVYCKFVVAVGQKKPA